MPRRISDYPDAFTGWNFISSIGSLISVAATVLFLHIVYLQLVKGKAIFGYPWAVPQLFSDYLRILKDKSAPGLEWALSNPPKPHAFTSLPLQSSANPDAERASIEDKITELENKEIPSGHAMQDEVDTLEGLESVKANQVQNLENMTNNIQESITNSSISLDDKRDLTQLTLEQHDQKIREVNEGYSVAKDLLADKLNITDMDTNIFLPFTIGGPTVITTLVLLKLYLNKSFRYFASIYYSIYSSRIHLICVSLLMCLVVYYSSFVISCDAPRAWGLYFQDSASPQMEALTELHDNIMYYLVAILFSVGWIQGAIIKNFDSAKSPISNKYLNHGTLIELIWTITPALILVLIAFPSFKLLYLMDEVTDPSLSVLAEGHQWYWSYEYPDFLNSDGDFIEFDSYLVPESDLEEGALRMLEVDNRVILPEITHTRFILTAADEIKAFSKHF